MSTTYRVVWPTGFDDHKQGDEFEADLDPAVEDRALERGQLEIVKGKPAKKQEEE